MGVIIFMINLLILFASVCLCFFILNLFHELGHALPVIVSGDKNWRIVLGKGKQILMTKHFTVNLLIWSGEFIRESGYRSKFQHLLVIIGGPIVNVLMAILCFSILDYVNSSSIDFPIVTKSFVHWCFTILFFGNVIQFLYTAIPIKLGDDYISDGMRLVKLLRS